MLVLKNHKFVPNAVMYGSKGAQVRGPEGLLARCIPFKTNGNIFAHRYNQDPGTLSGYTGAPPASRGELPPQYKIPADAVYVVFSFETPIAWVQEDGTVTIPDVRYSNTTTVHQTACRAWLGYALNVARVM